MLRIWMVGAGLLVIAGLATACSDSDSDSGVQAATSSTSGTTSAASPGETAVATPTAKPTKLPDETDKAKAALLTVADFPTGWSQEAPTDKKSPFDKCDDDATKKNQTGRAESGSFTRGSSVPSIGETVVIYATPADAVAAMDLLKPSMECRVKLINDGKLDDSDAAFSNASLSPVSYPTIGDRTLSMRVKFHIKSKRDKSEVDAFIDAVYVQSGRYAFDVVSTDVLSPFSADQLASLARKALAKLPN